jgi:hypothetical protein
MERGEPAVADDLGIDAVVQDELDLDIRSLKATMGMEMLRSKRPDLVRKEVALHLFHPIRRIDDIIGSSLLLRILAGEANKIGLYFTADDRAVRRLIVIGPPAMSAGTS